MLSFLPPRWRAPEPSTADLLARLAVGETEALEPLYRRESGPVYRYALALGGNPAWAADATHDAFLALVQRPQAFDPRLGSLGAWLAGIARHNLLARWRELRREVPHEAPQEVSDGAIDGAIDEPGGPDPATLLVQAQTAEQVWAALRRCRRCLPRRWCWSISRIALMPKRRPSSVCPSTRCARACTAAVCAWPSCCGRRRRLARNLAGRSQQ